ncbi:hypothetical protein J2P12_06590 [Candidatus Bathyarchaeota archaeon]|nr:hypothetical protein [Candidatus Bathyarchaeota archaeon]
MVVLDHYTYLLRAIRENQKKSLVEWNALIRTALLEIDNALGNESLIVEGEPSFSFEEYRKQMERIAANVQVSPSRELRLDKIAEKLPS